MQKNNSIAARLRALLTMIRPPRELDDFNARILRFQPIGACPTVRKDPRHGRPVSDIDKETDRCCG